MNTAQNKALLQHVFDELAQGNGVPFRDSLADDICWRFAGSTKWTKAYVGKQAVLGELLGPIFKQFASQYTSTPQRLIAADDYVVVETWGRAMTHSGKPYNNKYCYVCRLTDGRISEITEYMDTALADAVLADPA